MKALTLTQPWATLVAIGVKKIETRSWATTYCGPLAIHAAKKFPEDAQHLCFQVPFRQFLVERYSFMARGEIYFGKHEFPLGCVVATCELVDCIKIERFGPSYSFKHVQDETGMWHHTMTEAPIPPAEPELSFGNYTPGRYAWILSDVKPLPEPVPAKGAQRLWEWNQ